MKMKKLLTLMMIMSVCVLTANATTLSIYDIQYTENSSGDSPHDGSVVDCAGGIVINKWYSNSGIKLTIYDSENSTGWSGITATTPNETKFDAINVGDSVFFEKFIVKEYRGSTLLDYFNEDSTITVGTTGNAIPEAIEITESAFLEQYESMKVKVCDVEITEIGLGRKVDNYNLQNENGNYWAADYMNDVNGDYHSLVLDGYERNSVFESISGILEHQVKTESDGTEWDYYQMLTTETADFVVPEPITIILLAAGAAMLRRNRKIQ